MKATQRLHALGQSLWLDSISRRMLDDGTLRRYIDEFSVTGLTSNPTIFDEAIDAGDAYDDSIRTLAAEGRLGEALFIELALEDLRRAADLFRPIFESTDQIDGWASMELSPLLAGNTAGSVESAARIYRQADRPNLFVKIPGNAAGVGAIEESIFAGIPINVTLLFSREQYLASAEAYLRGIERRLAAGLDPRVGSVASVFISRWDKAVAEKVSPALHNRLGIAVAGVTYVAYRELLASERWRVLERAGAKPQRLLWGSTGTKDPKASDTLYVEALAAPDTINTIPEKTLRAFADHGKLRGPMALDGADSEQILVSFEREGIGIAALADELQRDGAEAFVKSWRSLLGKIAQKSEALSDAGVRSQ